MTTGPDWERAVRALTALAVDPAGLKGITVRARVGPVRATFESMISQLPGTVRRIPPGISDTQLFGGLNLAASLAEGRSVREEGLTGDPTAILVCPMAERTDPVVAAKLAQILDGNTSQLLFFLDESADGEDDAPACVRERLAFSADLDGIHLAEARLILQAPAEIDAARSLLPSVRSRADDILELTALAARFGIESLRAPVFALRAARVLAALAGREETSEEDILMAAVLVYPSRASVLPEDGGDTDPPAKPPNEKQEHAGQSEGALPDEVLVEAVRALLPKGLLETGKRASAGRLRGSGAGGLRTGNRRGRPLVARSGKPSGEKRIDVLATLRAAAPWQTIRKRDKPDAPFLIVRPSDIRIRRFEEFSDRLLIFVVDASGSAALGRLAEAKGAVECLLSEAYAKRDHVAVIAFRDRGAEVLLQPTRSLVQAKRGLAALPGGGGTPLASGLTEALGMVRRASTQGLCPSLAI
ncbi:MAG: VWA domain-containing protein, partial [Planctomycetes bacterium]|nr:VWA domain-containing protein [Planctomycetota bacterium]